MSKFLSYLQSRLIVALQSLSVLWDIRIWILAVPALFLTYKDTDLQLSLVSNLGIIFWIAMVAQIVRKVLLASSGRTGFIKQAQSTSIGAAIVIASDRILLAVLVVCATLWLK